MLGFGKTKWPQTLTLEGQTPLRVRLRVHPKARHYRLSISVAGEPILSVPTKGRLTDAKSFLHKQKNWLEVRLSRRSASVAFVEGAIIPIRGVEHVLVGTGKLRGQVSQTNLHDQPILSVPGGEAHMARRLTDWLKEQALTDLKVRSAIHAEQLNVQFGKLSIRGQSSRWGSCSSAGNLNYNWRLVLTPPFVLDYVAAHEVAHICEMNHSPAFWAKVSETLPDMERGRAWLKANGTEVMGYGIAPMK